MSGRIAKPRVLVVLPTFDERANLSSVVQGVRAAGFDVLVVDDNSPDGTGDLAAEIASRDPHVKVRRRPEKLGLGSAYVEGFRFGLEQGYAYLVEMDADGSHLAQHLTEIVAAAQGVDGLAIGSRYIPGGSVVGWGWRRVFLSWAANVYCRVVLGLDVHDATSGFRAYSAHALRVIGLDDVISDGYSFQVEMVYRCARSGIPVTEVPIRFEDRVQGRSKVSQAEIRNAIVNVVRLRLHPPRAGRQLAERLGSK